MTPAEIQYRLDVWKSKNQRADQRAAVIACVIANAHRDPQKRRRPYKVEDFMPKERKVLSVEQLEMVARQVFR